MPSPRRERASSNEDGIRARFSRFLQRSYASDYLGLVILVTGYLLIVMLVEPFHRMFSLDNLSLQYPHAEVERVSVFYNIVYAVLVPLAVTMAWAILSRPPLHKVHVTILGLLISVMLACFLTDAIKNAVGRPRPDLIARCKPQDDTPEHQLVTIEVCTETRHHVLQDGWRSFPSGHSSLAFSGLGFFALFLTGQMHVLRPRTDLARALIALAPLLGAALIAISRLEDYRHDVFDVLSGSLLGSLAAYFSYRRYFPRLKSPRCDTPYPSSREDGEAGGTGRLAKHIDEDDEEARIGRTAGVGSAVNRLDTWRHDSIDDELEERVPLRDSGRAESA